MFTISIGKIIFLCVALFFAGFVDSIAGGGGCISLPAYLLVGLPTQTAFACNKTSACLGTSVATYKYLKTGNINVKVTLISAICGIIGSNCAARIVLHLDPQLFQKIIICVTPFAALFLLIKKDYGTEDAFDTIPATKVWIVSILTGLILGLYDGIVGPGTGTFAIMIFASVLKFDLKTAGGNAKLLNFCTGLGAVIHFVASGAVIWPLALTTAASNIAGNYIGANLAIKKGAPFIRVMMSVAVIILLAKLAWDVFGA